MGERYVKEGMVAVLYSPGYGAGWYTWSSEKDENMVFDPELVEAVLGNNLPLMEEIAKCKWPDEYDGGLSGLKVEWMAPGTSFIITEYDGSESIRQYDDRCLVA